MKLIRDANVALKTVLPEPDSHIAIHLMDEFKRGLHELLAPDIFPVEIAHALTRSERQKRTTPPDGWRFWLAVMSNAPDFHAHVPLMQRAFEISSLKRIGLYDCLYVALAEREGCDLVTADEKLINNLPGFPIVSLASL